MKVFETDPLTSSTKKVYSTIYLTVLTRRKAGWFVANIFVPTFLMLVVSWLTFIYEPHGECIAFILVMSLFSKQSSQHRNSKISVVLTSAILHQFYLYCSLA
jgi:hypothetical protein